MGFFDKLKGAIDRVKAAAQDHADTNVAYPSLSGPMSDYMARVDRYVANLRKRSGLEVGYWRNAPATEAQLDALARGWGVDRFGDPIRNLYRQANGFVVFWVDTGHSEYEELWRDDDTSFDHFRSLTEPKSATDPSASESQVTTDDIEGFPTELGGVMYLLPCEDALDAEENPFDFDYSNAEDDEEDEFRGQLFQGSFERWLRAVEIGDNFRPICFLMGDDKANPPVLMGDDHGVDWEDSKLMSFEAFMESMLNRHLRDARETMGHGGSDDVVTIPFEAASLDAILEEIRD